MKFKNILGAALALLTLVIVGCGGGGGAGGSSTTVTGKAVKGPIVGASVKVYAAKEDGSLTLLQTTPANPITKAFGNYSATFNYSGPAVVEITGGTYTDEATNTPNVSAGIFRAAVANATGTTHVTVTPLSEIAVKNLVSAGSFTPGKITSANTGVANALGLTGLDVTTASPTENLNYRFLLAVISQAAAGGGSAAVDDLLKEMATGIDLTTGTITNPVIGQKLNDARVGAAINPHIVSAGILTGVDGTAVAGVAVTATPATGIVNKPVSISANVTKVFGGPVADGTPVTFTTSLGTTETVNTTNGIAAISLTSNSIGTVAVTAKAATVTGALSISIVSDPDAPGAISLSANSTTPFAGSSVTVTANVTRAAAAGGPVPDGTLVTFVTSAGNITANATTTNGVATATLSGVATPQTATVTAAAGTILSSPLSVNFLNPDAPTSVVVTANPSTGFTSGAPVTLTATVTRAAGGPVPDGTQVTFTASGSPTTVGTIGGVATATLSSATPANIAVTAQAGTIVGSLNVPFVVNPNDPASITVSANTTSLFTGTGPVTISANVTRAAGGPVPDGTQVNFTTTTGTIAASATTVNGIATASLTSNVAGPAIVTASAGTAAPGNVTVTFNNPNLPGSIVLAASPTSGVTNQPVTLTATVSPVGQNGTIANGTAVTFTILTGTGTLSSATATTTNGVASVTLNSAAVGTVTANAKAGTAPVVTSNTVSVPFLALLTQAVVTIQATGPLNGALIGAWDTDLQYPSSVTIATATGTNLAPSAFALSNAAAAVTGAQAIATSNAGNPNFVSVQYTAGAGAGITGTSPITLATLTFDLVTPSANPTLTIANFNPVITNINSAAIGSPSLEPGVNLTFTLSFK